MGWVGTEGDVKEMFPNCIVEMKDCKFLCDNCGGQLWMPSDCNCSLTIASSDSDSDDWSDDDSDNSLETVSFDDGKQDSNFDDEDEGTILKYEKYFQNYFKKSIEFLLCFNSFFYFKIQTLKDLTLRIWKQKKTMKSWTIH